MGIERFTDGQPRNASQLAIADEHPTLPGIANRVVDDGVLKNASRRQNRRRLRGHALDWHPVNRNLGAAHARSRRTLRISCGASILARAAPRGAVSCIRLFACVDVRNDI